MKKIYQKDFQSKTGDCLKACIASLFELPADAVPNFMRLDHFKIILWWDAYYNFMQWLGYELHYVKDLTLIGGYEGVDDLFIACVESQRFKGGAHAVIVNKSLEVVHDPNMNNKPPYKIKGFDVFKKIASKGVRDE